MTSIGRRRVFVAAMIATVLGTGLLAASPASAAPAPHTPGTAISGTTTPTGATSITFTRKATDGRATPDAVGSIHCEIDASGLYLIKPGATWGPYYSAYAVDAIGDTSWVVCSAPVAQIVVAANVQWNGLNYPSNNPSYSYNAATDGANYDITECAQGTWLSGGYAQVTAPPGYTPQSFPLQALNGPGTFVPSNECIS